MGHPWMPSAGAPPLPACDCTALGTDGLRPPVGRRSIVPACDPSWVLNALGRCRRQALLPPGQPVPREPCQQVDILVTVIIDRIVPFFGLASEPPAPDVHRARHPVDARPPCRMRSDPPQQDEPLGIMLVTGRVRAQQSPTPPECAGMGGGFDLIRPVSPARPTMRKNRRQAFMARRPERRRRSLPVPGRPCRPPFPRL